MRAGAPRKIARSPGAAGSRTFPPRRPSVRLREAVFVRRHAPEWEAMERRLRGSGDPSTLAADYVRLGDDLAYARTFYPGSATAAYLNDLSAEAHARLYRNRKEERGRLVRFVTHEIPLAAWEARGALLASFVLFGLAVGVGLLSSAGDDRFVRLILGDGYVNMTLGNIEAGDPMAVYKRMREVDMVLGIALNNIIVSVIAFLGLVQSGGAPAAHLGTGWTLVSTGVMVGAFAHLFAAEGLAAEWVRVVMIHGMLELSAVVVAGGAGFTMWNGLLFPGTYPRGASFRRGAVRGATLLVGLMPVFSVAALLEGVVTRRTEMPLWMSALVIGASAAFVVYYFVLLPRRRALAP